MCGCRFVKRSRPLLPAIAVILACAAMIALGGACDKGETGKTGKDKVKQAVRGFAGLDFDELPSDLGAAVQKIRGVQKWDPRKDAVTGAIPEGTADVRPFMNLKTNRSILDSSFKMGTAFILKNQKPEGNFNYMYDWLEKTWAKGDSQVRQAGALWGVALCHQFMPTPATKAALDKGLRFWLDQIVPGPQGTLLVRYKNERSTSTGTVALVALSIIEYMTTDDVIEPAYKQELTQTLKGLLGFLKWLQLDNGHFSRDFYLATRSRKERSSPYYDGETLLCLCKAARHLGYDDLVPVIERAARAMAQTYTVQAWKRDPDSKNTKGFYQWGSMSFAEYYESRWRDYELYGDITLALGWWMTHTHRTLTRSRNHAYAVEGLVSAYRIAKHRKDVDAMVDLLYVIDRSLYKLTKWQIGGPLANENKFLVENPTDDPMAVGGVMNSRKAYPLKPPKAGDTRHELRIDVTQHQMHAVTLAMEHAYPE